MSAGGAGYSVYEPGKIHLNNKAAFLIPMVRNVALIVDIVSLEVFRFNFKVSLGMAANGAKCRSLRANVDVAAV